MLKSPLFKKKSKREEIRSPSIPREIGTTNFYVYNDTDEPSAILDSVDLSYLGISKPSYGAPDKLDFSPVLKTRKNTNKAKSSLDKYKHISTFVTSPTSVLASHDDTSPDTTPLCTPNKAIKTVISAPRTGTTISTARSDLSRPSVENVSTDYLDGSIDMNRSVTEQVEKATITMEATNNDRLLKNERHNNYYSNYQSKQTFYQRHTARNRKDTSSNDSASRMTSNTSDSHVSTDGLGITPPPKSSTTRIIVPYVTPSDTDSNSFTVFILLIQPTQKIYELVRLKYNPAVATLQQLLDMIPENTTQEDLCHQTYVGLIRPNASSTSNKKSLSDLSLTASVMARDGSCARIVCGEVLAAVPKGFTAKETQIFSRYIVKTPKMVKLLSKNKSSSRRNRSSSRHPSLSTDDGLGIQPRNETGTFSSSILYAPLSETIVEEGSTMSFTTKAKERREREIQQRKIRPTVSLISDRERRHASDADDMSCASSVSSVHSLYSTAQSISSLKRYPQPKPSVHQTVTNIEMQEKLENLERIVKGISNPSSSSAPDACKESVTPLIVKDDSDNVSPKNESRDQVTLSTNQLEEIKREAAKAARVAAEEAFTKRMEELVSTLNVSEDEKNRLLEDDDMSFHSTIPFTMNATSSHFSTATNNYETCDFPVNFTITNPPRAPSEVRTMSPYESYSTQLPSSLLSPMTRSQVKPQMSVLVPNNQSYIPAPPLAQVSPQTTLEDESHKYFEEDEYDDDYEEDIESSLIAEALEGFYEVIKKTVSKFVARKKKSLGRLSSQVLESKMTLKLMTIVCVLVLSSQHMMGGINLDNVELNPMLMFKKEAFTASTQPNSSENGGENLKTGISLNEFQQVLFWFLILTKGQQFYKRARPQRRQRRAWKSRVIPVNA